MSKARREEIENEERRADLIRHIADLQLPELNEQKIEKHKDDKTESIPIFR